MAHFKGTPGRNRSLNWKRRSSQDLPQWLSKNHPTSHKPLHAHLYHSSWFSRSGKVLEHLLYFTLLCHSVISWTYICIRRHSCLASLPATFFSHLWCVHLILPNTLSTKKLSFRISAKSTTHLRQITFQQQNKIRTACDQIQPPPSLELRKCQNTGWVQVLLRPKAHIWGRMVQSRSNVADTDSSICRFYKLASSLLLIIIPLQYSYCLRVQEFLMLALFK